jgi:glutamate-5-semialdehyde dehydrogenase
MTEAEVFSAVETLARQARAASYQLSQLSTDAKNSILLAMAAGLRAHTSEILTANALDLAAGEAKGLSKPMLDRLKLDEKKVDSIASGIEQVAALPDPVGQVMDAWSRPNGMKLEQVRVPIGTIGIIFESRPNVTSDAAVLCFKTGNATILRGGSEAIHSNRAIAHALQTCGEKAGLPANAIQLVPFTDRSSVTALCQMDQWLDLIIPRGGKGLIEAVVSQARMPVIKHYDGICHLFVDAAADLDMAVKLTVDSKTCERTRAIIDAVPATEEDWGTEYLDLILSVKVVDSLHTAINHINTHGSHHTECIVTADESAAQAFITGCDSACVFHNVSTRLADGEEFGFGAEIGISTDKLHARGPMGLRELTSYQYRVRGNGQTKG